MRKTSTYIRKRRANPARCANPHSVWHVLNRTEPLREEERVQLTAPVRVSFEKFTAGTATQYDFDTLAAVYNMCMVVAETVNDEFLELTQRAQDSLMDIMARHKRTGRYGLDHASLDVLPDIIDVYEQLLEVCTPMQMKAAWQEVIERIKTGNTLPESQDI